MGLKSSNPYSAQPATKAVRKNGCATPRTSRATQTNGAFPANTHTTPHMPDSSQETIIPSIEFDNEELEAWYESVDRKRKRAEEEEENPPDAAERRQLKRLRRELVKAGIPQPKGFARPSPVSEHGDGDGDEEPEAKVRVSNGRFSLRYENGRTILKIQWGVVKRGRQHD